MPRASLLGSRTSVGLVGVSDCVSQTRNYFSRVKQRMMLRLLLFTCEAVRGPEGLGVRHTVSATLPMSMVDLMSSSTAKTSRPSLLPVS